MSADVRAAIYAVITALMGLLTVLQVIDADTASQLCEAAASLLAGLATLLALRHTPKDSHEQVG